MFYTKHGDEWVEQTPVETGQSEVESLTSEFDARTDLVPNASNHPDEVINGVRKRMMQGPLEGMNVLDRRVRNRLSYIRQNSRRYYKHIIDEEVRRRTAGLGRLDRVWNFVRGGRGRLERQVARDFFSYEQIPGANFNTLLMNLQAQINGLGVIGGVGFLDSRGNNINMANPNAVNEFDVAAGPTGMATFDTVVIRWHEEDFITIKKKLEQAGMWAEFSRQGSAREWIHLKFRKTQLKEVVNQEQGKLNNDRFNPQRLKTWLDTESTTQGLADAEFQSWVTDRSNPVLYPAAADRINTYANMNALRTGNPELYREMQQQQEEARQRTRTGSLEQKLRDILTPGQLENLSTSLETKAMLAYLQAGINDATDGPVLQRFVHDLAGRGDRVDTLDDTLTTWKNNESSVNDVLTSFTSRYSKLSALNQQIVDLEGQRGALGGVTRDTGGQLAEINNQLSSIRGQQAELQQELMNMTWNLRNFVDRNQTTPPYNAQIILLLGAITAQPGGGANVDLINGTFNNRPSTTDGVNDYLEAFSNLIGQPAFENALDNLKGSVEARKKRAEDELNAAKASQGTVEKMDSRGLLYKLVKRDLERRGVTEETGIHQKSLYAVNLIIAKARNADIYANTNEKVVEAIDSTAVGRLARNIGKYILPQDWLPVLSAKDVLSHVVDSDPDLAMFHDITIFSTRSDLIKAMKRLGKVTPRKLREFQQKLGEFIKGIEIPRDGGVVHQASRLGTKVDQLTQLQEIIGPTGKNIVPGKTYSIKNEEAPMVENVIRMLSLLEAQLTTENFVNNVRDQEEIDPEGDRPKLILDLLKEQTQTSRAMDSAIDNAVSSDEAQFKKRLKFGEMRNAYNDAMDELEGLPKDELDAELKKRGINTRTASRGLFSLRSRRFLKGLGKGVLKYGPWTWPYWGAKGGFGLWKMYSDKFLQTEIHKKASENTWSDLRSIARFPANVLGTVFINIPTRILRFIPRTYESIMSKSVNKGHTKIPQEYEK